MTTEQAVLFAVLAGALVLFAWNRLRYDIVALGALVLAVLLGAVPMDSAFSGFGHPAVITVAAVLVMSRALTLSGIVDLIAGLVGTWARGPTSLTVLLCGLAALLSAFMNNIAALALLLPVALGTARKIDVSPSLILMPLSFASLLGGMTTLIGTPPNIIIAQFREEATGVPFAMFDFLPVGLSVAALGILFIVLFGRHLVPGDRRAADADSELFPIKEYITELRVPADSRIAGKTIAAFEREVETPATVIGIIRAERRIGGWIRLEQMQQDDILLVQADAAMIKELVQETGLELVADVDLGKDLRSGGLSVMEAVVPPDAWVEGKTAAKLWLRSRYGINLIGIARQGRPFRERIRSVPLEAGDVLLVQGDTKLLPQAIAALGCLPLAPRGLSVNVRKTFLPSILFAIAVAAAAIGLVPPEVSLTAAVVALLVTGGLPARELYPAIDWPIIVLLGSMIPIGQALESTGAVGLIADGLIGLVGDAPPLVVLGVLMVATMMLTDIMNNAATALVMAPLAISLAATLGVNPDAFLIGVAVASSCAFLTPIGHQNNTLILGPGGYRFSDYWRLGLPLETLMVAGSLIVIPLVWPL